MWGAGNVGQASAWQGTPGEGSIRVKPALPISLRLARALNPTLLHLHFALCFGLKCTCSETWVGLGRQVRTLVGKVELSDQYLAGYMVYRLRMPYTEIWLRCV